MKLKDKKSEEKKLGQKGKHILRKGQIRNSPNDYWQLFYFGNMIIFCVLNNVVVAYRVNMDIQRI